jgi:hypothetical protein
MIGVVGGLLVEETVLLNSGFFIFKEYIISVTLYCVTWRTFARDS